LPNRNDGLLLKESKTFIDINHKILLRREQPYFMPNKNKQDALKQAVDYLKLTIPRMKDLEIPITPENYFIWYEYERGNNSDLSKAIDEHLKSGAAFTEALNNELFEQFFSERDTETVTGVQEGTAKLVENLLSELESMQAGTQNFSNTLEQSQDTLNKNPDINAITQLVANLIEETDQVKRVNSSMEQKLNVMKDEVDILKQDMDALNTSAYTDQLTNIPNRRAFDETINKLLDKYQSVGSIFSLLFIDIDHFKLFNDTHGHAIGDKVLTFIASILKKGIKGSDMVARYGGEEFVVLLPKTDYQGAMIVAKQLCDKIAKKTLIMGGESKTSLGNITISTGVSLISPEDEIASLIERADKALYQAKEQGRNRVVGEQTLEI